MSVVSYFKHIWLAVRNKRELDSPLFIKYTKNESDVETLDFMKEIINKQIDSIEGPRTVVKGFRTKQQREETDSK